MENNSKQYYPLGNKTLFMLILRKSGMFFMFFIILVLLVVAFNYVPAEYSAISLYIIFGYLAFLLVVFLLTLGIGWLEYFRFGISISDEDLRIKRGLIATEEMGIPYRRIRDIKIQRGLIDQLFGVSNIVVILSDFEGKEPVFEESTVFLPSLDKNIAIEIQNSILKKSQIEQIHVVDMHDDVISKIK